MAEILLGHSYFLRHDPKEWRAGKPYPPLGTLHAAAALRARGRDVAVFDAMLAAGAEEGRARILRERPRIFVLYEDSFNYLSKMCLGRMREAALSMARAARDAGARVLASGSDVTDHRRLYADAGVELVIVGEGETTLVEAADAILSGGDARDVPGTSWLEGDRVQEAPRRTPERDLDVFPSPAWDLVDLDLYRRHWHARHGFFSLNLVTSRGCPYRCNWCAKPIFSNRYGHHGAERIARDVALLRARYGADHVWFADDIFGLAPGWLASFAEHSRGAGVPYKCLSRADLLDDGAVAALRASGCAELWIGAESGSQRILDAMEKDVTVAQIESAAARLKAAGIKVGFFLQFGYEGEELPDIHRTLELLARALPDEIGISVSYPLPGTPFHERVRARLGAKTNWDDSADLDTLYETPYGRSFYRALPPVVHRYHRLHRGIAAARGVARGALSARALSRVAAIPVNAALLGMNRSRLHALAARRVTPARTGA
ncbi:MAG: radical SAM protein [Acidobacteriota bacterium]